MKDLPEEIGKDGQCPWQDCLKYINFSDVTIPR